MSAVDDRAEAAGTTTPDRPTQDRPTQHGPARDGDVTDARRPTVGLPVVASGLLAAGVSVAAVAEPSFVVVPAAALATAWVAWRVVHGLEFLVLVLLATRPLVDIAARSGGVAGELPSLLGVALLGAGSLWLWLNRRRHDPDARPTFLLASAVAVAVAATLATLASPEPVTSAVDSLRLGGGLLMLLLVARLVGAGTPAVRILTAWGTAAAFAMSFPLLGPVLGVSVTHVKDGATALRSSFFLSNNFAHFLVPVVLVATGLALRLQGRARVVAGTVAVVGVLELGLTATRGAWLAVLVGLLTLGLLLERRLVAVLAIVAVVVGLLVPPVNERLVDLLPDDAPRTESSLAWRFGQWEDVVPNVADSPVVGVGPGMTRETAGKEPHSEWVRFLVELGGLGLLAWTALVASMVHVAVRARRLTRPGSVEDGFTAGVLAVVVAFVVATFGENLVLTTSYSWYLMALLGIVDAWTSRGPATSPARLRLPAMPWRT